MPTHDAWKPSIETFVRSREQVKFIICSRGLHQRVLMMQTCLQAAFSCSSPCSATFLVVCPCESAFTLEATTALWLVGLTPWNLLAGYYPPFHIIHGTPTLLSYENNRCLQFLHRRQRGSERSKLCRWRQDCWPSSWRENWKSMEKCFRTWPASTEK